jgi:hypothetical protein
MYGRRFLIMARVIVTLKADELDALIELAERERRDPRSEAALLLREKLIECGCLPPDMSTPTTSTAQLVGIQHVSG